MPEDEASCVRVANPRVGQRITFAQRAASVRSDPDDAILIVRTHAPPVAVARRHVQLLIRTHDNFAQPAEPGRRIACEIYLVRGHAVRCAIDRNAM